MKDKRTFIQKLQDQYTSAYEIRKKLRKALIIVASVYSVLLLVYAYWNYDFSWYFKKLFIVIGVVFVIVLIAKLFHKYFGKWIIHETKRRLTITFIEEKLPRSIKFDGNRGAGKDSTVNALRKIWREDILNKLNDEMLMCEMIAYPYDFDKLSEYLDEHKEMFMSNSKSDFFSSFIVMMKDNECFIKKYYKKDFIVDSHLKELYQIQKSPYSINFKDIKYKYHDGLKTQHYLSLLIKYSILYIRLKYIDNFLFSNQPSMETEEKTAKLFSTRFTNIQKKNSEWPWPLDGNIMIIETESDALYPNVGNKKGNKPMDTGLRNFKAFFRHLFGELSVWINIGQKSARTEKSLRELDHAFITVIEQSKVLGGEKRIYFLEKWFSWVRFWMYKSFRQKAKEKQYRRRSRIIERIKQLENTGYIYVDLKVSRSDYPGKADEMSLKRLLSYDKAILENYSVKLCFHIKDCYWGYNTTFLESIAEMKAKKSKLKTQDVMSWDPDMKLKQKHILYMEYGILDKMVGIDRKKLEQQKQKEKEKSDDKKEIQEKG